MFLLKEVDFVTALAFYPCYSDAGLVTQVVYPDKTTCTALSINTVVRHACRQFALDRQALSNAARFVSGKPHLVPLPLCVDRTFGPLKVLSPLVPGDAVYGYFLIQAIVRIEVTSDGTQILLRNGVTVPIVQARNVALSHMARAILFERAFWSKRLGLSYCVDRQELWE